MEHRVELSRLQQQEGQRMAHLSVLGMFQNAKASLGDAADHGPQQEETEVTMPITKNGTVIGYSLCVFDVETSTEDTLDNLKIALGRGTIVSYPSEGRTQGGTLVYFDRTNVPEGGEWITLHFSNKHSALLAPSGGWSVEVLDA